MKHEVKELKKILAAHNIKAPVRFTVLKEAKARLDATNEQIKTLRAAGVIVLDAVGGQLEAMGLEAPSPRAVEARYK